MAKIKNRYLALMQEYFLILGIAKGQDGINIKIEIKRNKKTKIFIQNMLDDKVITAKEFHDDHESLEKTLPKVKNLRIELEKRRGKVTKRQYKDYIDYIEIYYKLAVLIRRDKNADITFLAMQYNSKQTAIAIESDSKKIEPMMMTIDEIQPESYNRLVEACNTIARDITELELEEDDRNDLNEYDKQKA